MDLADTIAHYEAPGRHYSTLIAPNPARSAPPRCSASSRPRGRARVLEVGSGAGRDADSPRVRRHRGRPHRRAPTFVEIQAERGRSVGRLNVATDDFGGPYAGVLALCVLMHVDRSSIDGVLRRSPPPCALAGGSSSRSGRARERTPPPAAMAFWTRDAFERRLLRAGLTVEWFDLEVDCDRGGLADLLRARPGDLQHRLNPRPQLLPFGQPPQQIEREGRRRFDGIAVTPACAACSEHSVVSPTQWPPAIERSQASWWVCTSRTSGSNPLTAQRASTASL